MAGFSLVQIKEKPVFFDSSLLPIFRDDKFYFVAWQVVHSFLFISIATLIIIAVSLTFVSLSRDCIWFLNNSL